MSARVGIRSRYVSKVALAAALTAHFLAFAQTEPQVGWPAARIEEFKATAINLSKSGENIAFRVSRWSTDADRDRLLATFTEKGVEGLRVALAASQTLGYAWTSEPLGYSLRYAHRMHQPDGSTRIILATDRPLALPGSPPKSTKASDRSKTVDYPFTVIELRLNRNGIGEGRTSTITADPNAKTIALENYDKAAVILKNVREESAR